MTQAALVQHGVGFTDVLMRVGYYIYLANCAWSVLPN